MNFEVSQQGILLAWQLLTQISLNVCVCVAKAGESHKSYIKAEVSFLFTTRLGPCPPDPHLPMLRCLQLRTLTLPVSADRPRTPFPALQGVRAPPVSP